ncbi:unnamed protein product [Effrenium voratum]|nr:unnamed protein product [Effrenium voratum]
MAEVRRGCLPRWLVLCAAALFASQTAFVAAPSLRRGAAVALQARTRTQEPARGITFSPQMEKRVASLKREAIMACLAAVQDDPEAVERCARLSRKLSYVKAIIRRQMEDMAEAGIHLGEI